MPFVGREVITGEETFVVWLESEKVNVVNGDNIWQWEWEKYERRDEIVNFNNIH